MLDQLDLKETQERSVIKDHMEYKDHSDQLALTELMALEPQDQKVIKDLMDLKDLWDQED